nr:TolC family protein [Spirochaeta thermophila]
MKRIFSLLLFLSCTLSTVGIEPLTLSLQEAISLSLEASPDLFQRERTLALAHLSYRLGFYAYAPLLSLSFSDSRTVYYSNPDTLQTSLGAQLSIPLYRGGRRILQQESTRLSLNTTQEEVLTTRAETTITCMQAYYQVLIAQEKQKLLQNMVSLAREQQRIAEVEYRTGAIRELDLVEISLQVQEMELSLSEAERSLRESEYTLKKLLGVPPETEILLTDTLPPLTAVSTSLRSLSLSSRSPSPTTKSSRPSTSRCVPSIFRRRCSHHSGTLMWIFRQASEYQERTSPSVFLASR